MREEDRSARKLWEEQPKETAWSLTRLFPFLCMFKMIPKEALTSDAPQRKKTVLCERTAVMAPIASDPRQGAAPRTAKSQLSCGSEHVAGDS